MVVKEWSKVTRPFNLNASIRLHARAAGVCLCIWEGRRNGHQFVSYSISMSFSSLYKNSASLTTHGVVLYILMSASGSMVNPQSNIRSHYIVDSRMVMWPKVMWLSLLLPRKQGVIFKCTFQFVHYREPENHLGYKF